MNKHEELRRIATAALDPTDDQAGDAFSELATPANVLELLTEIDTLVEDHDKQWRRAEVFGNNGVVLAELAENKHKLLVQLARFIVMNTPKGFTDWGCKQCAPHSEMLGDGLFVCGFHQAQAILKDNPTS
jgi:hypothetical protein